jgi:amidohydrolase
MENNVLPNNQIYEQAEELFNFTQALRRDFHKNPELGFQEFRTAGIVARELNELHLEVTTGVGKTGVIGLLEGVYPGPILLLRFDMDALPINEENERDYSSCQSGVMHACGHDAHTAVGLTVAKLLCRHRDDIHGVVKFMFQPAEEGLGGAEAMIADGVLNDPKPDMALSMHVWNEKPVGWLGITAGPVMAAAESFRVWIKGKGGHGALPSAAIDPILASSHIINSLQSIVSRNVHPLKTAVVSVTTIHGGEAFNVIPQEVVFKGTIRTFESDIRQRVLTRFRDIIEQSANAMECTADIELKSITPALINDPKISDIANQVASEILPDYELDNNSRTMGSEDMAFVLQQVPGCFIFIGSANSDAGLAYPHHHPRFDFDEVVLPKVTSLMTATTLRLLSGIS